MSNKTQFEKDLQQKLNSYEPISPHSNWSLMEKKLNTSAKSWWKNAGLISASVIIVALATFFFINNIIDIKDQTAENIKTENVSDNIQQDKKEVTKTGTDSKPADSETPVSNVNRNAQPNVISSDKKENNEVTENVSNEDYSENVIDEKSDKNINEQKNDCDSINDNKTKVLNSVQVSISQSEGCLPMEVNFTTNASPEDYEFEWHFGDGEVSNNPDPVHIYNESGEYEPVLHLTPIKDDLQKERITVDKIYTYGIKNLKINFDNNKNLYTFITGKDEADWNYYWSINDEDFESAVVQYEFKKDGVYPVHLKVEDEYGCTKEAEKQVSVNIEHDYFVPNAINLASYGENSRFIPEGEGLEQMKFKMLIFDRTGQIIFKTEDINNPWKGKNMKSGEVVPEGVYLWKITTEDEYGNVKHRKGQVTLLRK